MGLVSRSGIVPISHIQDTAGPMARTVEDAAILLGVLAGVDGDDPATWASDGRAHSDYTRFLDRDGLRGIRIGIARSFYERLDKERLALLGAAEEALRDAGAETVDVSIQMPQGWQSQSLVHEFKPAINKYLSRLSPRVSVHSLRELVEFNDKEPYKMLRYGQSILVASEATGGTLTEPSYISGRAREERFSRQEGIDRALADHRVEALFFPYIMNASISARAGYPSITVPIGYTGEGRPMGVTFAGTAYSESELICFGYAFEQATRMRMPPELT